MYNIVDNAVWTHVNKRSYWNIFNIIFKKIEVLFRPKHVLNSSGHVEAFYHHFFQKRHDVIYADEGSIDFAVAKYFL